MSTYSYSYYQQQQPGLQNGAFSTQQGGMTWNGSQWVSSSTTAAPAPFPGSYGQLGTSSTGQAYGQRGQWQQPQRPPQRQDCSSQAPHAPPPAPPAPPGHPTEPAPTGSEDPSVLVTRYSLYYQSWKVQADEQRSKANSLLPGPDRDEASRKAQWADYYANQSSTSAHHYNGLVQQRQQQQQSEPSPPSPPQPQQQPAQNQLPKRKSRWSERPPATAADPLPKLSGPPASPTKRDSNEPPPESLKRYVHRCLSRCRTDAQRSAMQAEVERTISDNIRANTMYSTDWDSKPLMPVPNENEGGGRPVSASSSSSGSGTWGGNDSQNKRARTGESDSSPYNKNNDKRKFGRYDENLPANDSYYGNAGGSDDSYKGKFGGKQDFFLSLSGKSRSSLKSDLRKRDFDDQRYGSKSKFSGGSEQDLPKNNSYYGSYGPSRDDSSSVRSDDRSRGRGRGDDGSLASEQDFISLSSHSRKQSKKKQHQKKGNQKSQQQKQAAYQRSDSAVSTGSAKDGFERSTKTLAARASRFSGRGGISDAVDATTRSDAGMNVDRYMGKGVISGMKKVLDETDYERMTVKGTCMVLEKEYLRLTSPPRAELVRPKHILEKHLSNLKKLWGKEEKDRGGNGRRDYLWFCSQFKALRQDLTVQRIFDPFTIEVYETHARIALEKGDLNEYNQCQTQLKELYEQVSRSKGTGVASADTTDEKEAHQGDGKKKKKARTGLENQHEFIAYRVIYYVYLTGNKKYEGGSSDLFKILLSLTPEQREDPVIAHSLKVRVAVAEFDYHAFFSLQDSAPKMGAYLMDYIVPQVRQAALQRMHKAYRPSVPVKHVLKELGFDNDDPQDAEDGRQWLQSCGCKLSEDRETFLTKDSILKESDREDKKSSLI